MTGGRTIGGEQVHYNREPLKGNHSRGHMALHGGRWSLLVSPPTCICNLWLSTQISMWMGKKERIA